LAEDIEATAEVMHTPAIQSLADFLLPSFG
jgi:hypothetical protein